MRGVFELGCKIGRDDTVHIECKGWPSLLVVGLFGVTR